MSMMSVVMGWFSTAVIDGSDPYGQRDNCSKPKNHRRA